MDAVVKAAKKVWHFIWHSDSPLSWVVNILLAYLIIRYMFYPGLGLLFGTSFPVVAVVSGSMEHGYAPMENQFGQQVIQDGMIGYQLCGEIVYHEPKRFNMRKFVDSDTYWETCGSWYEERNITQEAFEQFIFPRGFNKGDIIFIYGEDPKNIKTGDVIVFVTPIRAEPIIHRVIYTGDRITTKGDHNADIGPVDRDIPPEAVVGKATFRLPWLGWVKIWFIEVVAMIRGGS